ncbi:phospholipase A and acyltransferase 3-like isoform X2 [Amphiura filiformis]|uniref:phospholipase A and acyltransferase 3-like isoform X1 n=1 Tax=Amphiura filiformis TaxID=82378 RepID=UPI003B221A1D
MSDDHFGVKTKWMHPDSLQPIAGDIIQFKRKKGMYKHLGIADGEGGIYHFGVDPAICSLDCVMRSDSNMKNLAHWRHDTIKDVAKHDLVRIDNSADHKSTPLGVYEIIQRCKDSLDKFWNEYDPVSNNCEHKTSEMRYSLRESLQVERVKIAGWSTMCTLYIGLAAVGVLFGVVLVGVFVFKFTTTSTLDITSKLSTLNITGNITMIIGNITYTVDDIDKIFGRGGRS